ncbi:cytochrome c maturation protein CcmE [Legionella sp. W05-934-2]|jgi:cytochrome c-type biogenesis protein CcmE|uniref:cytochrome c maturation protein CcmE n=1 Tax=Legionella sp. W05-934-2 TaxID=1198649 RepID=UPI003462BE96
MNPVRRQRLLLIVSLLVGLLIVLGLVLYALRQNISLFYTPTQIMHHEAPINQTIRLGGMVKQGSVSRKPGGLEVQFTLTDFANDVVVFYEGILPDLFREGQGIVTTGTMNEKGRFQASNVLAKHDENYMPPEVKASMQKTLKTGASS